MSTAVDMLERRAVCGREDGWSKRWFGRSSGYGPDQGKEVRLESPLGGGHEMGKGFLGGFLVGLDPVAVLGIDDEHEVMIGVLGETKERGAAKFGGFGPGGGLEGAFMRAPFDVSSVAGVDEIDSLGGEVSQVESVEVVGAQLEDGGDFLAVEVEDFEAPIVEDARQEEKEVLHWNVEAMGEFAEDWLMD